MPLSAFVVGLIFGALLSVSYWLGYWKGSKR